MRIFSFFLVILCAGPAWAWNAAGHRLVAAIAWQTLDPASRAAATALLAQHPDYALWQARQRESDVDYGVFLEASTWADDIRHDPRFGEAGAALPPLPGFPDRERHADWHYHDGARGEIDRRLPLLARQLRQGPPAARVHALVWLIHLVADLHQPLHCGGRDDAGGNAYMVENPLRRRRAIVALHAYWDELPGPSWLRGPYLEVARARLMRLPAPVQGDVALWFAESQALLDEAYPAGADVFLPILTPEFQARAQEIADQRVAAAGIRLGRWLKRLLKP
jgi:hypothetical protein